MKMMLLIAFDFYFYTFLLQSFFKDHQVANFQPLSTESSYAINLNITRLLCRYKDKLSVLKVKNQSWILSAISTSTGVDTEAMPTTDLEQAAWDTSVMHVSTGADTDGNSMAVVSVPGDETDGPTSTGEGAAGTTRTRTINSDGGATSEQENSSSRLISVEESFDIVAESP